MRGMLAVYVGLSLAFLGLAYLRSESGLIHAFDTGLYLEILSQLQAGRGWMSSIVQEQQFLAHHFQPILLVLWPFHFLAGSAWMLLLVGWLAASVSGFYLAYALPRRGLASPARAGLAALAFFLHPALSSRMYYSFVPEVLALPALAYLAVRLAERRSLSRREMGGVLLALSAVGLCKENFWLVSAGVAFLFGIQEKTALPRAILISVGLAFVGVMLFLFLHWMPEHSTLKGYYGLSYFQRPGIDPDWGLPGRMLGAFLNTFSVPSLTTAAVVLVFIPCGLIFFGSIWTTLAALPTVVLVLAASNDQIHDLTNHYLLGALPFLAVSLATGAERVAAKIRAEKTRFYGGILLILVPAGLTFMHHSGWLFQFLFASERVEWRLRAATLDLKKDLDPDSLILIDGQLQPFFHELPRVRIIQAFQGNPSPLNAEDRAMAAHIITANDLSGLQNCDEVITDGRELVRYDIGRFLDYCRWLKSLEFERRIYLPERLIHLKIKRPKIRESRGTKRNLTPRGA